MEAWRTKIDPHFHPQIPEDGSPLHAHQDVPFDPRAPLWVRDRTGTRVRVHFARLSTTYWMETTEVPFTVRPLRDEAEGATRGQALTTLVPMAEEWALRTHAFHKGDSPDEPGWLRYRLEPIGPGDPKTPPPDVRIAFATKDGARLPGVPVKPTPK